MNQTLPSGPAVIPWGALPDVGIGNWPSTVPDVVIRLMVLLLAAMYQSLPSGPLVMKFALPGVDRGNSVIVPAGVIRAIWFALLWVNQTFPSGPAVMPRGPLLAVGIGNSVTAPVGVMRPTLLVDSWTYQKFPSAPRAMPWASPAGMANSLIVPGAGAALAGDVSARGMISMKASTALARRDRSIGLSLSGESDHHRQMAPDDDVSTTDHVPVSVQPSHWHVGPCATLEQVARGDGRLNHDLLPGEKGPQDACGVFGVWAPGDEVAKLTYFGLYALQHRGQESAGIATSDGSQILVYKDMGLVSQVFSDSLLDSLHGYIAIGHARYSTTGSSVWENAQPTFRTTATGHLALGHNGNLTNTHELAQRLATLDTGELPLDASMVATFRHRPAHGTAGGTSGRDDRAGGDD